MEFMVGIGLVFALEGLAFAAFPGFVQRRMREALELDEGRMRLVGLASAVIGVALVWLARRLLA